jgi:hypothetical protein
LIPSPFVFRPSDCPKGMLTYKGFVANLLATARRHTVRAMAWLPWLAAALLVAAVLSPGTVTASRLVFQSAPATPMPTLTPPPPTPPPPTATPLPPTATPPPPPTPTPPPPEPAPTGPLPTETLPPQEVQPVPAVEVTEPLAPPLQVTEPLPVPYQATEPPVAPPAPTAEQPPSVEPGQPIINWVKFWDTMAVTLAYPWLCCGIGLLLLMPIFLLYLEIKGRRRPPTPPERIPPERLLTGKKGNEE